MLFRLCNGLIVTFAPQFDIEYIFVKMNNIPSVTKHLLIWNILFSFAAYVLKGYGIDLNSILGLHFFMASDFQPYQFFTYMFLHADFYHLFFNMFAVWMFGRILEQVWGSQRFLFYYIVCGVGAGLCQELVQYIEYATELAQYKNVDLGGTIISMGEFLNMINTVGASGSVYGILLAFGMLFPNQEMFIFPLPIPIKAKFFVIGYAAIEIYLGLANQAGDNVAHFAHLGGMLFGFIMIMYWRKKYRNERFY